MKKKIILILFIASAAAQLFIAVSSIVLNERILANGAVYRFRTEPVDPYDPFRGKYINLDVERSIIADAAYRFEEGEKVYVLLERDEDSFARFAGISEGKPSSADYIELKISYISGNEIEFEIPFGRYYIDEDYAEEAEAAYWSESLDGETFIEVRVLGGHAVLEELFLDGMPVLDYLDS